jgi:signal transduction histidine kinase
LYQDSVIHRVLGIDDRVKDLQASPPGMFFYNQRAIFFAGSFLSLFIVSVGAVLFGGGDKEIRTIETLWAFWAITALVTVALHPSFVRRLVRWSESEITSRLPPLFGRYFLIDFTLVFSLIFVGKIQGLSLDVFAFLLVANTIIYSAYVGGGRGFSLLLPGILYLLLVLTFLFFPVPGASTLWQTPLWFNRGLYVCSLVSMLIVSIISVTLISWLRSTEYQTTQRQLELLGRYENWLAGVESENRSGKDSKHAKAPDPEVVREFSELQFRRRVHEVLEDLCAHKVLFWYDSACLWFTKYHQDRKLLLLPGPSVNFEEGKNYKQGIDATQGLLSTNELIIVNSMKHRHGKWKAFTPRFRADHDAPAAFVPLCRGRKRIGVLALYGRPGESQPPRQDRAFLESLGAIISNTMEQWEGRFKSVPQRDMNELFECQTLDEVFKKVVVILQKYLRAAACEVIFRPDEHGKQMKVVAALGFKTDRCDITYTAGRGKTGECAEKGKPIRIDDVQVNRLKGFDPEYLSALENAHGETVTSWMAIPIGGRQHNYGVIKVMNRTAPWGWFTDEDQELGEELAVRLHVIIEKFLYIERTLTAKKEAEQKAQQAKVNEAAASAAKKRAEVAAQQQQTALMTMTHQLQGPLNPVVGALSGLQQFALPRHVLEEIEYAKALAESCLTLCWGTSATFAKLAGQKISFALDEIDAPAEMHKLARMLQLTNTESRLDFKYREDADFPKLRIDRAIFISVVFSLIHNAMKYAERDSTVFLECSFERDTGEAAVKVKSIGVRIYPDEKEKIFEPFERGQALKNTSFKYKGTGLGLWVAKQLMLSVGGDLTVELSREHPDLSVFIVHIPGGLETSE